jgi:hypothetical protein
MAGQPRDKTHHGRAMESQAKRRLDIADLRYEATDCERNARGWKDTDCHRSSGAASKVG